MFRVARNTQGSPIINIKPFLLMSSKWLDVMRVQFAPIFATFLASVAVAAKYLVAPLFIRCSFADQVLFAGDAALPVRGAFFRLMNAPALDRAIKGFAFGPSSWARKCLVASGTSNSEIATLPRGVIRTSIALPPTSPRAVFHFCAFGFGLLNFGRDSLELFAAIRAHQVNANPFRFPIARAGTVFRFIAWGALECFAALGACVVHNESYTGELGVCQ